MASAVALSVHLRDGDELTCLSYRTCYAPFVVVRLTEGVNLYLGDVATAEALAAVVDDARKALVAIEANPDCSVS